MSEGSYNIIILYVNSSIFYNNLTRSDKFTSNSDYLLLSLPLIIYNVSNGKKEREN